MLNQSIFKFLDEDEMNDIVNKFQEYFKESDFGSSKHSDNYHIKAKYARKINDELIFIKYQILNKEKVSNDEIFKSLEKYLYKKVSLSNIHKIFTLIGIK